MAHSKITEKLDLITHDELGIRFDEGLVWEKLDARLGNEPKVLPIRRMVAAAVFLGVLLLPLTLLKDQATLDSFGTIAEHPGTEQLGTDGALVIEATKPINSELIAANTLDESTHQLLDIHTKKVELKMASIATPSLAPVAFQPPQEQKIKPQFAVEDISIIQASFEKASINDQRIETGTKLSISAQWNGSNSSSDVLNAESEKALTLRLLDSKARTQK